MDDINHCHTRTGSFILFVLVFKDTIRTQQKEATCRTTFERRSLAYPDSRRSIPSINCSRSEISLITVANPGSYSETSRIPIAKFLSIFRFFYFSVTRGQTTFRIQIVRFTSIPRFFLHLCYSSARFPSIPPFLLISVILKYKVHLEYRQRGFHPSIYFFIISVILKDKIHYIDSEISIHTPCFVSSSHSTSKQI